MRAALLAVALAAGALALLPGAAEAKHCGRQPLGEGSGTSAAAIITRNLSCARGISILDRHFERADKLCSRGVCPVIRVSGYRCVQYRTKPRVRCVRGKRGARAEFGL
jgi:hypothetical protein